MPSKGNHVLYTRVSRELLAALVEQIELSNMTRFEEPWTVATFIEMAISEKLAKMKRSRKHREQRLPRRAETEN